MVEELDNPFGRITTHGTNDTKYFGISIIGNEGFDIRRMKSRYEFV